jgi:hypothetical protein
MAAKDDLLGIWAIYGSAGDRDNHNLEIGTDPERANRLVAQFWHWKPGALGADTRSSEVVTIDLGEVSPVKPDIVLTGEIGYTDGSTGPLEVRMSLRDATDAAGSITDRDGSRSVVFRKIETEPLYVVAQV